MVQSIAHRLLPHCPTGPVLDMLVAATGTIPTSGLSGVPSDEVVWPLYKRLSAEAACVLVEHTTSPELLRKVFAREKRVSVRRSFARNPHLPEDLHEILAQRVGESYDAVLAQDLAQGTSAEKRIPLLMRPGFHTVRSNVMFVNAVLKMDLAVRDDLLLEQMQLLPDAARWYVAEHFARSEGLKPDTILALVIGAVPSPRYMPEPVFRAVLQQASPEDRPRLGAEILEYAPLPGALCALVHHLEDCELTLGDVLEAVHSDEDRLQVWRTAISQEVEVDLDLVPQLLVISESLSEAQRAALRCTPEARSSLLREGPLGLQAVLLREAEVAEAVRALNASAELRAAFRCSGERLEELHLAGLEHDVLVELIQSAGGKPYYSHRSSLLLTERLREYVVACGSHELFSQLEPTPAEAEVLLRREDVRAEPEFVSFALRYAGDLPEDLRRSSITALPPNGIAQLLLSSRGTLMRSGDLTWLLETCHADALRTLLAEATGSYFVEGAWLDEGVYLLALPWARITNTLLLKKIAAALLELLGDDLARWHAALALLPEWEGTLPELVEVLDQLG